MSHCPSCGVEPVLHPHAVGALHRCPGCGRVRMNLSQARRLLGDETWRRLRPALDAEAPALAEPCPDCGGLRSRRGIEHAGAPLAFELCKRCLLLWFADGVVDRLLAGAPTAGESPAAFHPSRPLQDALHKRAVDGAAGGPGLRELAGSVESAWKDLSGRSDGAAAPRRLEPGAETARRELAEAERAARERAGLAEPVAGSGSWRERTLETDRAAGVESTAFDGPALPRDLRRGSAPATTFLGRIAGLDDGQGNADVDPRFLVLLVVLLAAGAFGLLHPETIHSLGFVPAAPFRHWGLTIPASFFLHGGWGHLLFNLYFLKVFGDDVCARQGFVRFLGLLGAAHLGGMLLEWISFGLPLVPRVGASAGVAGAMGWYLVHFPRRRLNIYFFFFRFFALPAWLWIGFWAFLQLSAAVGGGQSDVANWAHVGGLAVGVVWALADRIRFAQAGGRGTAAPPRR